MKRFFKISLLLILIGLFSINISADRIESIDVKVNIKNDGTMEILQEWKVYNNEGTEYYIPIQNLNHMELENFRVSSSFDNQDWIEIDPWRVKAGFNDKRFAYGINYTSDGIELCWGKTEMGDYSYNVQFDYRNAVQSFEDYDGFLVRFVNDQMSPAPQRVNVVIKAEGVDLNKDNSRIWSFGNRGTINFVDGKVVADVSNFDSYSHMTIMMRFDKGVLNPDYIASGSFEELQEEAFVGSSFDIEDSKPQKKGFFYKLARFLNQFRVLIWMLIIYLFTKIGQKIANYRKVNNLKEVDFKNPPYYRDVLLDNFLPAIYFMAYQKDAPKNFHENTFSAYFLKWIKDGALRIDEYSNLRGNNEPQVLELYKDPDIKSPVEARMWRIVTEAAGSNRILEPKELEKYFKRHYQKYTKLFDDLYKEGVEYLVQNGMIVMEKGMKFTEKGIEECQNAYAMRRFFKDFTLINERGVKEVDLWDYYLIIATMYGMGEEVSKAFEKLVPEYVYASEQYNNGFYIHPNDMYYLTRRMGRSASAGYGSGAAKAASAGYGGASFGGGGGFSGGGSGGGSR